MLVNVRDINRRTDIPKVFVSQSTKGIEIHHKNFRTVKMEKDVIKKYRESLAPDKPFFSRVAAFLSATNKAGRKAKVLKDFALIFLPYGKQVGNVTELITELIISPMNKANTQTEAKPKKKSESKQIITFSLLLVASILMHFGIDFGLELTPDAAWITTGTSVVGILLRLVTKKPVELGELTKTLLRQKN